MSRLRDEIQSVVGNDAELKREDLKRLIFLSHVLKESMFPNRRVGL